MSEKCSPVVQTEIRRKIVDQQRSAKITARFIPWTIAFTSFAVEVFLLQSALGNFFFKSYVGKDVIAAVEYGLLAYLFTMWSSVIWYMIRPVDTLVYTVNTPPPKPVEDSDKSILNQSKMDSSWVEGHSFGYKSSPSLSNRSMRCGGSFHESFGDFDRSGDVSLGQISRTAASPKTRMMDTIFTRDQLDRLLQKDHEHSRLDTSSSSIKNSIHYFSMFDNGLNSSKEYQISSDNKDLDESGVKFVDGGRVCLSPRASTTEDMDEMSKLKLLFKQVKNSPKKAAGSPLLRRTDSAERRRRSHSSPDRQLSIGSTPIPELSGFGSRLDEKCLFRGEHRLRAWIVNTIISPLFEHIKRVNILLEKEHANPPLHIGTSSVDALKTALSSRENLRSTTLPYILPYLSVHSNQAYVVSRIGELAADPFMGAYKWNSGGREPVDEKLVGPKSREARRPWGEHLLTDAHLVFSLFCAYMDCKVTSNPLVGVNSINQPFTAMYTVKTPQRPITCQSSPNSFYIHFASLSPPQLELVSTDASGLTAREPVAKNNSNLFRVLLQFVNHAKIANGGYIDVLSIGKTGLNIACILD